MLTAARFNAAPAVTLTLLVCVVPLPKPLTPVILNVPALTVVVPVQAFVAESAKVPEPTLVKLSPEPEMAPLIVNKFPLLVTPNVVLPTKVMAPPKILLPPELTSAIAPAPLTPVPVTLVILLLIVSELPLIANSALLAIVTLPLLMAVLFAAVNVPALICVMPPKVFAFDNNKLPPPTLIKL